MRWIGPALLAAIASPADAETVRDWHVYVSEASARFAVPAAWIEAVMRVESGGRTRLGGRPIRSRAGAIGLMQLMPATWAEMRNIYGLGNDPDDPRDNILAGAAYLKMMFDRFGYPGLFAAYNAGPGHYGDSLIRGAALPGETRRYLLAIGQPGPSGPASATRRGPSDHTIRVAGGDPAKQTLKRGSTLFVALGAGFGGQSGAPSARPVAGPAVIPVTVPATPDPALFVSLSRR